MYLLVVVKCQYFSYYNYILFKSTIYIHYMNGLCILHQKQVVYTKGRPVSDCHGTSCHVVFTRIITSRTYHHSRDAMQQSLIVLFKCFACGMGWTD